MIILEDSRQKVRKHDLKHKWFEENGVEVMRTKLFVGDYTLPANQSVCVDTKKDIHELIQDIIYQHDRFVDECVRATETGIQLVILVENTEGYLNKEKSIKNEVVRSIKDLHHWKNPRLFIMKNSKEPMGYYKNGRPRYKRVQAFPKATRGTTIAKACASMELKYGVKFEFCTPEESGARIIELLKGVE